MMKKCHMHTGYILLLLSLVMATMVIPAVSNDLLPAELTAAWDNFKTNQDVAIGRLKFAQENWTWHGLSTATNEDLILLKAKGISDKSSAST